MSFFEGKKRSRLYRRGLGAFIVVWGIALLLTLAVPIAPARADLRVDITRGQVEPMPIAVSNFFGASEEAGEFGRKISEVIARNLERSGLFRPIDNRAFIQGSESMQSGPRFADWRQINAQALVTGRVQVVTGDRMEVEFHLWDIFAEEHLVGMRLGPEPSGQWRRIAHRASDEVYRRLTGEVGYFDTRIVYIAETGPADKRTKRLAIMDQDGHNLRYLTDGQELVLTPRFSPTALEITYLSYNQGIPRVNLLKIDSGQQEVLGKFPGMTFAPRFSPDGNSVILTMATEGNSDIFEMDLRSHKVHRLTNNPTATETAPSYSPNGDAIVFESDRSGEQQIYVMERKGSQSRRITFGKGRYMTPVWSPRGDLIAFTKSHRGRFYIGVIKPDGSGERILSQDYLVEGPTWAPNGRVLMFFRKPSHNPDSSELVSIDITGHNERIVFTTTDASDPAWSPLTP